MKYDMPLHDNLRDIHWEKVTEDVSRDKEYFFQNVIVPLIVNESCCNTNDKNANRNKLLEIIFRIHPELATRKLSPHAISLQLVCQLNFRAPPSLVRTVLNAYRSGSLYSVGDPALFWALDFEEVGDDTCYEMLSDRNLTIVEMLLKEGPEVATMNPTAAFFRHGSIMEMLVALWKSDKLVNEGFMKENNLLRFTDMLLRTRAEQLILRYPSYVTVGGKVPALSSSALMLCILCILAEPWKCGFVNVLKSAPNLKRYIRRSVRDLSSTELHFLMSKAAQSGCPWDEGMNVFFDGVSGRLSMSLLMVYASASVDVDLSMLYALYRESLFSV